MPQDREPVRRVDVHGFEHRTGRRGSVQIPERAVDTSGDHAGVRAECLPAARRSRSRNHRVERDGGILRTPQRHVCNCIRRSERPRMVERGKRSTIRTPLHRGAVELLRLVLFVGLDECHDIRRLLCGPHGEDEDREREQGDDEVVDSLGQHLEHGRLLVP